MPDFSDVTPQDAPAFITPNHEASRDLPLDPPIRNVRKQLFGDSAPKDKRPIVDAFVPEKVVNRKGQFVQPVTDFYTMIGMTVSAFKPQVGIVIVENARATAEAWNDLAHENEAVRRHLKGFLTFNATGAVVIAHVPIAMAILSEVPFFQKKMGEAFADGVEEDMRNP